LKLQETLGMDVGEELRVTLEIISEVLFVVVVAWDENNDDKNNPSIIKLHDENNHFFESHTLAGYYNLTSCTFHHWSPT
jgi:hypothetical protein